MAAWRNSSCTVCLPPDSEILQLIVFSPWLPMWMLASSPSGERSTLPCLAAPASTFLFGGPGAMPRVSSFIPLKWLRGLGIRFRVPPNRQAWVGGHWTYTPYVSLYIAHTLFLPAQTVRVLPPSANARPDAPGKPPRTQAHRSAGLPARCSSSRPSAATPARVWEPSLRLESTCCP